MCRGQSAYNHMKNISPIKMWSAREQVVNSLREAILTSELKAGERLVLSDLSARLGVSATPIREALQSLEREGLVQLMPHKEAIVVGIDRKYVTDYYVTRAVLESEAAAMACEAEDLLPLQMALDEMEQIIRMEKFSEYAEANFKLHETIWKLADNERMEGILKTLFISNSLARNTSLKDNALVSFEEHKEIVRAIEERNGEEAKRKMRAHMMRSLRDTMSKYDE